MANRRANRVSIATDRYRDLVSAALVAPCFCASEELRKHDGRCISCWALATYLEYVREVASKPLPGVDATIVSQSTALLQRRIDELEREQRLRAEELPAAIERLRIAREEEDRG